MIPTTEDLERHEAAAALGRAIAETEPAKFVAQLLLGDGWSWTLTGLLVAGWLALGIVTGAL